MDYGLENFTQFVPASRQAEPQINQMTARYDNPPQSQYTFGNSPISKRQYADLQKIGSLSQMGLPDQALQSYFLKSLFQDPEEEKDMEMEKDLKFANMYSQMGDVDTAKSIMSRYLDFPTQPQGNKSFYRGGITNVDDLLAGIENLNVGDRVDAFDALISNEENAGAKSGIENLKDYYTRTDYGSNLPFFSDLQNRINTLFSGNDFEDGQKEQNRNSRSALEDRYRQTLMDYGVL